MATPAEQLRQAVDAVARLGCSSADYEALSDAAALSGQRDIATARQLLDTCAAWMAGTIARRSRPELGHSGLAAQQGFLSPEAMIQKFTGSSKNEAFKLVAVGTMLAHTEAADRQPGVQLPSQAGTGATDSGTGAPDPGGMPDTAGVPIASAAPTSWQAPIARAVAAGTLSVDAAESIRRGLGDIDTAVTAERLATALAALLAEATVLNADQCFIRARRMRDDLDTAGIAAREKQAYDDRYLRIYRLRDGKVRLHGLFAPEDGEFVLSTYDSITSPRRGGVRFVDKKRAAWAKKIQEDPRTTEQIAADSFLQLLKLGTEVDPGTMLGGRRPAVRVIVQESDLTRQTRQTGQTDQTGQTGQTGQTTRTAGVPTPASTESQTAQATPATTAPTSTTAPVAPVAPASISAPAEDLNQTETLPVSQIHLPPWIPQTSQTSQASLAGYGYLEGCPVPVSLAAVERQICDTGIRGILVSDTGQPLDVGREQRLFTEEQRAALSLRDGGCRWPDCTQPPAWSEAHHINRWLLDHGLTNLADGISLCHPHHLLLHNKGWQILRNGETHWLKPPVTVDPGQTLIPLPSQARAKA